MYVVNNIAYAGSPMTDLSVDSVRLLDDGMLVVRFSTGEERLFDTTQLKRFPAFASIDDAEVQRSVKVDHGIVTWADGELDYATEAIYAESYPYEAPAEVMGLLKVS